MVPVSAAWTIRTMDPESVAEVAQRDGIDLLLHTLRNDFDLTDIEQTLQVFDAAFGSMKEGTAGNSENTRPAESSRNSDAIFCHTGEKIREE